MSRYVLDHHLEGEKQRLALMSQLLDPMHRRYIESLGNSRDSPGARSRLRQRFDVGVDGRGYCPDGQIVALDLDLSLVGDLHASRVEFRQGDIVAAPVKRGRFDLVTARAVLHHVSVGAAIDNLVASLKPGAAILLIEPDFLPVSVAEPANIQNFWNGWLAWSRKRGID